MIQDGYGDCLDHAAEAVAERERLVHMLARRHSQSEDLREELAQEARITIWQVATAKPEASGPYLNGAADKRILGLAMGRALLTGQAGRQGVERDPLRRTDRDSLDEPVPGTEGLTAGALLQAAIDVEEVALAYHYGEICQAIAELPVEQRDYVYMRFWRGMTQAEIAAVKGVKSASLTDWWGTRIRPRLKQRLAHLAGAV